MRQKRYRAMISSDWNQCLAPCGPYDPIMYHYPHIAEDLSGLLNEYTGNKISLGTAIDRVRTLLPAPLTKEHMDDYLDSCFTTYQGVSELISWCHEHDTLFMINTTGTIGYFQRIFAKNLLPPIHVLSANPMIRYPHAPSDPPHIYELNEIDDKGPCTGRAQESHTISSKNVAIIGDSGGDGPHFTWGDMHGAYMIGSMAKQSLTRYCQEHGIKIHLLWGPQHSNNEGGQEAKEMMVDFMDLCSVLVNILTER